MSETEDLKNQVDQLQKTVSQLEANQELMFKWIAELSKQDFNIATNTFAGLMKLFSPNPEGKFVGFGLVELQETITSVTENAKSLDKWVKDLESEEK